MGRPTAGRRWLLAKPHEEAEGRLVAELGLSPLLARLLANRGLTDPTAADAFLGAHLSQHLRSPMLFRDMDRAAERVRTALRGGERIGIYGDYDVDGISGTAILCRFLRALGSEPLIHIPHRLRDGYGMTEAGVRRLAEAGARVIVTVDCGGVSHREIGLARSLGIDVIVCDHHQVSGTPLGAYAVLNPIEPDAGFPFPGLCGAGVAFYLAAGVRMQLRAAGITALPDLRRYLGLVALGTIADLVPMVEENRVLVKHGLRELATTGHPGVTALKAVSAVEQVSAGAVAFRLAPRLNAGGRLTDATRSVELLTTDDPVRAQQLAASLDEENQTRQSIEKQMAAEAISQVEAAGGIGDRCAIVLASADWHPGIVGIVAARLVERFYRPAIVIAVDEEHGTARGSARSIPGVSIYDIIHSCRDWLEGFGGHKMAAGLTIRPAQIKSFAASIEMAAKQRITPDHFVPVRRVDCALRLSEIDQDCLRDLDRIEPHGPGNGQPVFISKGVKIISSRVVGDSHLKLVLEQDETRFSAIGFSMGDFPAKVGDRLDILFRPMVNHWNGTATVELRLDELRPHRENGAVADR